MVTRRKISKKAQAELAQMKWRVVVRYRGLDGEFDDALRKLSGRYRCIEGGSGFFFPKDTRDLSFLFKTKRSAERFVAQAVKVPGKVRHLRFSLKEQE